jgi:hypothetical protein
MTTNGIKNSGKSQSDKFKEAAKEHGADPSVRRWDERMRKLAKAKPQKDS